MLRTPDEARRRGREQAERRPAAPAGGGRAATRPARVSRQSSGIEVGPLRLRWRVSKRTSPSTLGGPEGTPTQGKARTPRPRPGAARRAAGGDELRPEVVPSFAASAAWRVGSNREATWRSSGIPNGTPNFATLTAAEEPSAASAPTARPATSPRRTRPLGQQHRAGHPEREQRRRARPSPAC